MNNIVTGIVGQHLLAVSMRKGEQIVGHTPRNGPGKFGISGETEGEQLGTQHLLMICTERVDVEQEFQ